MTGLRTVDPRQDGTAPSQCPSVCPPPGECAQVTPRKVLLWRLSDGLRPSLPHLVLPTAPQLPPNPPAHLPTRSEYVHVYVSSTLGWAKSSLSSGGGGRKFSSGVWALRTPCSHPEVGSCERGVRAHPVAPLSGRPAAEARSALGCEDTGSNGPAFSCVSRSLPSYASSTRS